jgi:hypothetical protein
VLRCVDDYLRGVRHPLDLLKKVGDGGLLSRRATG